MSPMTGTCATAATITAYLFLMRVITRRDGDPKGTTVAVASFNRQSLVIAPLPGASRPARAASGDAPEAGPLWKGARLKFVPRGSGLELRPDGGCHGFARGPGGHCAFPAGRGCDLRLHSDENVRPLAEFECSIMATTSPRSATGDDNGEVQGWVLASRLSSVGAGVSAPIASTRFAGGLPRLLGRRPWMQPEPADGRGDLRSPPRLSANRSGDTS